MWIYYSKNLKYVLSLFKQQTWWYLIRMVGVHIDTKKGKNDSNIVAKKRPRYICIFVWFFFNKISSKYNDQYLLNCLSMYIFISMNKLFHTNIYMHLMLRFSETDRGIMKQNKTLVENRRKKFYLFKSFHRGSRDIDVQNIL